MSGIRAALESDAGSATSLRFMPDELTRIRDLIRAQWLARIWQMAPRVAPEFEAIEMDRYHEQAHLIDHKAAWPKIERILDDEAVAAIRDMSVFRRLEKEFGTFSISNEEEWRREEIYWRLVRPNNTDDVGPLHADEWFWNLGHGKMPPGHRRIKVWIAVYCERGKSGFRFVPGSHRRNWRYHGEQRDGFIKPQIDEPEEELEVRIFESDPGQLIVFHDRMLHGGAVGGARTRVSLEFTMLVNEEHYLHGPRQFLFGHA